MQLQTTDGMVEPEEVQKRTVEGLKEYIQMCYELRPRGDLIHITECIRTLSVSPPGELFCLCIPWNPPWRQSAVIRQAHDSLLRAEKGGLTESGVRRRSQSQKDHWNIICSWKNKIRALQMGLLAEGACRQLLSHLPFNEEKSVS